MKTVILTAGAQKQLEALPLPAQEQITTSLYAYATTGQGDVKRMTGRAGYRLRAGSYRVVFDEDRTTVLAVYVGRRSSNTYSRN